MKKVVGLLAAFLMLQTTAVLADDIVIKASKLYPEGIAYSPRKSAFLVSSMRSGKIGWVDMHGTYKELVDDPLLISTLGMQIDLKRNVLYAAVADPDVSDKSTPQSSFKTARLAAFDLKTGKKKWIVDLTALTDKSEKHLANDVALGPDGSIYVTDTFSPYIYKVTPAGKTSVFAHNDALWRKDGFGINGIVYHPDGYLIINMTNTGEMYRISVASPNEIHKIEAPLVPGADGMVLHGSNTSELLVMSFTSDKIRRMQSNDGWKSAIVTQTVASVTPAPSTGLWLNGSYYVLNSRITDAFDKRSPRSESEFTIQKVTFPN